MEERRPRRHRHHHRRLSSASRRHPRSPRRRRLRLCRHRRQGRRPLHSPHQHRRSSCRRRLSPLHRLPLHLAPPRPHQRRLSAMRRCSQERTARRLAGVGTRPWRPATAALSTQRPLPRLRCCRRRPHPVPLLHPRQHRQPLPHGRRRQRRRRRRLRQPRRCQLRPLPCRHLQPHPNPRSATIPCSPRKTASWEAAPGTRRCRRAARSSFRRRPRRPRLRRLHRRRHPPRRLPLLHRLWLNATIPCSLGKTAS